MKRNFIFIYLIAIFAFFILALPGAAAVKDIVENDPEKKMSYAIGLYRSGMFEAAEKEFIDILNLTDLQDGAIYAEIEAYLTLIAIDLGRSNMEASYVKMEDFYANSSQMEEVRIKYASYLFNEEKFTDAVRIYERIWEKNLNKEQRSEYNFKYGYTSLRTGNSMKAGELFDKVISSSYTQYTNPAYYYKAHIYYMKSDFGNAVDIFNIIVKDPRFAESAAYYMLESKFMLKDYDYVISNGEEFYEKSKGEHKIKSARLLSEAFFALENVEKADYYFNLFSLNHADFSRNDVYFAGILAYTKGEYHNAIELLKQVTAQSDMLSQNAAYHLGRCNIEIRNKIEACNSFREAAQLPFDPAIKEDAFFNYAKLSFDLNSDISVFNEYLQEYSPPDAKFDEIQNYIASSYILNQDYKSAIDILSKIRNQGRNEILNLQKASMLRGMQLIELDAYRDVLPILENALSKGNYNNDLNNIMQFWLAESYFRNNQFRKSADIGLSLTSSKNSFVQSREYHTAVYNLGYSFFKLGDFEQAESRFNSYLRFTGSLPYAYEARVRLGDSRFMLHKYKEAIDSYALIPEEVPTLYQYARFQMSIAYGLFGDEKQKISILKELIADRKSYLYSDALYELGRTLVQTGNGSEAQAYFEELRNNSADESYRTKALLELGLISLNSGEYEKSLELYKRVVEESPQSQEAQSALSGLENIYQQTGRAEEYLAYIDSIGFNSAKTSSERELILFNSAENLFLARNYTGAIASLNSFLLAYPDGGKSIQAFFYLGESYAQTGAPELALDTYFKVMEKGEGSFAELATLNYAKISYQLEKYDQAAKAYSSLSRIAKLENNIKEAQLGKMRSCYMDRQYENAISEGQRLRTTGITANEMREARYIIGKSYYMLGKRDDAMPYLTELSKNKLTPEGAESSYMIISDLFDKGDFAKVQDEVYAFSESNSPQSYWLARAFILLGDSFAEMSNWEQAEATFLSILESYRPEKKDDIEEQIRMRLSRINEQKNQ